MKLWRHLKQNLPVQFNADLRSANRLHMLHEIDQAITSTLDLRAVLKALLEKMDLLLPYPALEVWLFNGASGVFEPVACRNINTEEQWRAGNLKAPPPPVKAVIEHRTPVQVSDLQTDPRTERLEFFCKEGLVSYLGVPLMAKGKVLGVLALFTKEKHPFSEEEVEFLSMLAEQVAPAIYNSQLYEQTKRRAAELEKDIAKRKQTEAKVKQTYAELDRSEKTLAKALVDLKMSHEELKATQLQLIQAAKLESVGRLAAGVAHEVKNPLAIILMGVDYLSKRLANSEDRTSMILKDINNAVRRANSVVKGLLDFSAAGELRTNIEELNSVIEQSLLLVKHELDRHHITLVKELGKNLPLARLDRNKIEQVFVNVFMNATYAMPNGGTLTVKTYGKQLTGPGRNESHRRADHLSIGETVLIAEVEDTGPGIPEDQLPKIFDPFFTTKPTGKGTGLGLTVTNKIIELHRGRIDIGNRKEGGVRVRIVFQAQRRE